MNAFAPAAEQGTATPPAHPSVACSSCNLLDLCLPVSPAEQELQQLDGMIVTRRPVARGARLYRAGDVFDALFAVRLGFMKSQVSSADGREQVTGFYMAGEFVGLDGLGNGHHACDVIALEDSEVCVIAYTRLEQVSAALPTLRQHLHQVMSREIVRGHGVMLLLGSMGADERLAAFLLNLSQRFEARGYSRHEFVLRMTRAEIGSYLGLKLETVSRVLSRFAREGRIAVDARRIRLLDPAAIRAVVDGRSRVRD